VNKRILSLAGVTVLVSSLALTGCGSRDTGASAPSGKVATIGVIAPLTGKLSAMGLGIKNSVDLAIQQANKNGTIPGWTLKLDAEDDAATPATGQNAATKLAGDDTVVGVVGTLNSSVAQVVTPVLAPKNIVQISPANTAVALTRGDKVDAPARPYNNYFRVCATDDVQGPFAAQYLYKQGFTSVATVNDKKTYGLGLATAFEKAFKAAGGTITASETVGENDTDFSAVIAKVKATNPKALYYGGEYPAAGPLSRQMKAAGLNIPLMGGDGIKDDQFMAQGGSDGDLATFPGADIESIATGTGFLQAYKAAGYADGYSAYGADAYDAANAIIKALATTLPSATDTASARQAIVTAVGATSFDGVTGKVAFDQYGDAVTKVLTVYEVQGGKWVAKESGALGK
jgi:branched-chain amino acid transport system substrate-binding protein